MFALLLCSRIVKELNAVNNTGQVQRLLKILSQDFALSMNPNSRKGGLIGLAAMSIALGKVCNEFNSIDSSLENKQALLI